MVTLPPSSQLSAQGPAGLIPAGCYSSFFPNLSSYNVNSLSHYATSHALRRRKQRVLQNLLHISPHNSFLCIQETKLKALDTSALRSHFPGWTTYYSNHQGHGARAGVAILASPTVANFTPTVLHLPPFCDGHALVVQFVDPSSRVRPFAIVNLYLPQGTAEKIQVLKAVSSLNLPQDLSVAGDFNFVERPQDSASPNTFSLTGALEACWRSFSTKLHLTSRTPTRSCATCRVNWSRPGLTGSTLPTGWSIKPSPPLSPSFPTSLTRSFPASTPTLRPSRAPITSR